MNKQVRTQLNSIYRQIDSLTDELEDLTLNQQAVYDNIPENLRESERGVAQEEIVDCLDTAVETFRQGLTDLQEAIDR